MIVKIQGTLEHVESGAAHLSLGDGLTYEILLPAYASARLGGSLDQPITLHTLHFLESQNQGATMQPRLAGFLTAEDKAFYELFTTVKGIGARKALRAMALDTAALASAIADRDAKMLQSLPEIGKRMAETVIATLHGKVDRFVSAASYRPGPAGAGDGPTPSTPGGSVARGALEVLLQLGESRAEAVQWIDQALQADQERPDSVEALVARVYAIKAGA